MHIFVPAIKFPYKFGNSEIMLFFVQHPVPLNKIFTGFYGDLWQKGNLKHLKPDKEQCI